jgi:hypothetical protein
LRIPPFLILNLKIKNKSLKLYQRAEALSNNGILLGLEERA